MRRYFTLVLLSLFSSFVFPGTPADSLVRFSDLSFQSEFEKQVFKSNQPVDEFNLCLASDKNMTPEKAATLKSSFNEIVKQLEKEKLTNKNFRQKFANAHKIIFYKSPMQYYDNAEFSDVLNNGYFSYVTSSVLYSLALKELKIPFYYLFTLNKTNVIINPDAEQIILEARNRKDENGYFNSSDNNSYIVSLLDKNIRIGSEYQYNSSGGYSVVRFKESDVLKSNQLGATIYFYKAIQQLNARQNEEAYRLISKACYLYPDETFINSMYLMLTDRMNECKFDKIEDVDILGQISRFDANNFDNIRKSFHNILGRGIDKNDMAFCTAAYNRLLPQINDVTLADEISYVYYLGLAYSHRFAEEGLEPAFQALKLRPNDKFALNVIESTLNNMKYRYDDKKTLLDTLNRYENQLNNTNVSDVMKNIKLLLYLDIAKEFFMRNKTKEGVQYLSLFESGFKLPLPNTDFRVRIENAYYEYARYYVRFNNLAMAKKIVNKGLEYIPHSNMIESATYNIPVNKPVITHRKMNKAEYDKYMKKQGM
ncbi:MAG TPA: hypothetical protein VFK73_10115 [Paludibacter sp.]|nr:hypothetical protein [Paludibacter sp.]